MTYNPLVLAQQCVEMLGGDAVVLSKKETEAQWHLLKRMVPFSKNGKVEWEKIKQKVLVGSTKDIVNALQTLLPQPVDTSLYLQWSDDSLPILKTDLDAILPLLDQIRKVTFELFLFNAQQGYLIEFLSKNQITVGLVKPLEKAIN